ncbi:MAG: hypothetical protein ABR970_11155 [Roseiarcus sp.]|jgi:hypothetical protein
MTDSYIHRSLIADHTNGAAVVDFNGGPDTSSRLSVIGRDRSTRHRAASPGSGSGEIFGNLWKPLEIFGSLWRSLEISWKFLFRWFWSQFQWVARKQRRFEGSRRFGCSDDPGGDGD